jgi:hypothetical protein
MRRREVHCGLDQVTVELSQLAGAFAREGHQDIVFAEAQHPVRRGESVMVDAVVRVDLALPPPQLVLAVFAVEAEAHDLLDGKTEPYRARRG